MAAARTSTSRILLRSILPSRDSLLFSCLLALVIIGSHAISLAVSGQANPTGLHDVFLKSYSDYVLKPLAHVMGSNAASSAVTLLVWGIVGLITFQAIAFVTHNLSDIRNAHRNIAEPHAGVVVKHPLARTTLLHIVWRLLIGIGLIAYTVAIVPLMHSCLLNDYHLLDTVSALERLQTLAVTAVVWMLIFHIYVILVRFYLFRTRIFGEIIY